MSDGENTAAIGVDLFDDMPTADATPTPDSETATAPVGTEDENGEVAPDGVESADSAPEVPIETVSEIPAGAVSVTEFARLISQHLMTVKIKAGEDLDGTEFTVPQSVYQTVKASKDRIPHVLVKSADDDEPRVYILTDAAMPWWMARREKLATRGAGSTRASNRTPEDNLTLLSAAVQKALYANDRQAMWIERAEQAKNLVDKYKGFLKDASVAEDTVALAVQEATDAYAAEKAEKAAEKEKASKKAPVAATAE